MTWRREQVEAYTRAVERARKAYDEDPLAASRGSALRELQAARTFGRVSRQQYEYDLADIEQCYLIEDSET
jgi:L-alanine-DL-glutamate epimerase-like enolase superfamily enzyme